MDFAKARFNMVEQQVRPWDILSFDVLDALADIPREEFVLPEQKGYAYADVPLKLLNGSYMLEPKIIARMAQGLALQKTDHVLEVGTGSGYATAILATLGGMIHTIDIDAQQQQFAHIILNRLNFTNIQFEIGDGLNGGSNAQAVYDAIYVGGSLATVPQLLLQRLSRNGGRMVVIVGGKPVQKCLLITRQGDEFTNKVLFDTLTKGLNEKDVPQVKEFVF